MPPQKQADDAQKPVLYTYWRSSCSWRVRLALNLKKIEYEPVFINLVKGEQKSDKYAAISAGQSLPTLQIDGLTLNQSVAILEYLDETRPDTCPLLPKDPAKRALVRAIVCQIVSDTQPLQNLRVIQFYATKVTAGRTESTAEDKEAAKAEWARYWIMNGLQAVEKILQSSAGRYCVGEVVTMADLCLLPQMYNAERFAVDLKAFPTIQRVCAALTQLEAVQRAAPDAQADKPT